MKEDEIKKEVEVPNITGLTLKEAKKVLEENKLEISYENTEEDLSERIVTKQVPIDGVKIYEGTKVVVQFDESTN